MFINMNDFGSSLFDELRRLEREMAPPSGWTSNIRSASRADFPAINVGSNADQIDIYLFMPGIDINGLDLSIQQNLLTVAGERRFISEDGADYFRKERYDGPFRRVVTLSDDIDPDQVAADYKDGVLHVSIQRREAAKPRQIKVS